jgi:hypothetical protein
MAGSGRGTSGRSFPAPRGNAFELVRVGHVENGPRGLCRMSPPRAEAFPMTRTSTRAALRCGQCGSTDVLSVAMNMDDGGVQFRTCTECEATWWEREGARVERTAALTAIPRR